MLARTSAPIPSAQLHAPIAIWAYGAVYGTAHLLATAVRADNPPLPVVPLCATDEAAIAALRNTREYARLDRATLMAVEAATRCMHGTAWTAAERAHMGVNLGSARGATATLEATHQQLHNSGQVPPHTSPYTTAGHIAATVAQALGAQQGPAFFHSMTCSSGAFALANAAAWLRAGMATHFLAGGTEAPLTPYVLAQMQALGIYAPQLPWPCQPFSGQGGLMLGEGAACFALTLDADGSTAPHRPKPLGYLRGIGLGNEAIPSPTGISAGGDCLVRAMQQALAQAPNCTPDLVLAHAPGTPQGDAAELAALHSVFGAKLPPLYSTKWQTGHTFGSSAGISLVWALRLFAGQALPLPPASLPPFTLPHYTPPSAPVRAVLLNSVGFGGNAVSLLVTAE